MESKTDKDEWQRDVPVAPPEDEDLKTLVRLTPRRITGMMLEMGLQLRASRCLGWVAALALAFVPSATCLIGAQQADSMACHDAMEHGDSHGAIDQTCCPGDSASSPSSSPAQLSTSVSAPSTVLVAILPVPIGSSLLAHAGDIDDAATVKPPGTATFVLISSFRI